MQRSGLVSFGMTLQRALWVFQRLIAINRELQAARAEIARLAAGEERLRLARDLHDSVKQQVFVTSMEIGAARALLERDPRSAKTHLEEADAANRRVQEDLNALIHEMRPLGTQGRGLAAAVRDYAADWSHRHRIRVAVRVRGGIEVSSGVEESLLRVVQESLTNVLKHSRASEALIDLERAGDELRLSVRDNGIGFDPASDAGRGFGLASMRERVEELGGRVWVESRRGGGTRITCACSLRPGVGWR